MNPVLISAARFAAPHLMAMTRGKRQKMIVGAGKWAAAQLLKKQKLAAARVALTGLGVAAVALPVGLWVGKKLLERSGSARSN